MTFVGRLFILDIQDENYEYHITTAQIYNKYKQVMQTFRPAAGIETAPLAT